MFARLRDTANLPALFKAFCTLSWCNYNLCKSDVLADCQRKPIWNIQNVGSNLCVILLILLAPSSAVRGNERAPCNAFLFSSWGSWTCILQHSRWYDISVFCPQVQVLFTGSGFGHFALAVPNVYELCDKVKKNGEPFSCHLASYSEIACNLSWM